MIENVNFSIGYHLESSRAVLMSVPPGLINTWKFLYPCIYTIELVANSQKTVFCN